MGIMGKWLLIWVPKEPRMPRLVIETARDIFVTAGGIFLASVVLPTLLDRGSLEVLGLGGLGTIAFWTGAVLMSWRTL